MLQVESGDNHYARHFVCSGVARGRNRLLFSGVTHIPGRKIILEYTLAKVRVAGASLSTGCLSAVRFRFK
jgi:hypothetical protein